MAQFVVIAGGCDAASTEHDAHASTGQSFLLLYGSF
jgi:hypothetical protein